MTKTNLAHLLFFVAILFAFAATSSYAQEAFRKPPILTRKAWNAKKPVGTAKTHKIRFITVHHTGTAQKPDLPLEKKLQNLQAFSQRDDKLASGKAKPAWFDVPYHYYISVDGRIGEGRQIKYVGDTNTEYDPIGHALVVVEGSFGKEELSKEQVESLNRTVTWLAHKFKVNADAIQGHSDYAKTECPGENLKELLPVLRDLVRKPTKPRP